MKQTPTTPPAREDFPRPFPTLVSGDLQTTRDKCRRAMTDVESVPEADEKVGSALQEGSMQNFQQMDNGSPLVVLMILAGDIITIMFALLWLFRWR
jgi:hypothetical protein